jgi:Spy/CpxP family protein refolding chaperone
MKTNIWRQGGVVLALVILMAVPGWSAGDERKMDDQRPELGRGIAKRLGLNEEQKKAFVEREEKIRQAIKQEREEIGKLEAKLKDEMKKDNPDKNNVNNYLKEIGAVREKIQMKRMENLLELKKSLTPEQKLKFNEMLSQRERRPIFGGWGRKPGRK